ncbi:peroxygenase 3 [Apiospora arundinis]|uniref:Peroxygenase 3 n=1 Tax=Apiospora arundinis TaxID=335852 RepID=A0ABR2IXM1_9PEZI
MSNVPVTVERKPFFQPEEVERLPHPETARVNIAATYKKPTGTEGWADNNKDKTPQDTFKGFRLVGFNIFLSLLAVFIIHANFSYPSDDNILPDPLFRVYLRNIHKDKHGSDSGTYDHEGRFSPQQFHSIFVKYAEGRDYLTAWDIWKMLKGQRVIMDPIGWFGAFFEWFATYLMLWPEDGKIWKEDMRRVYDGSIFHIMAQRRAQESKAT